MTRFARMVQTVDSHTEGNSTRVITGGIKPPPGETLWEKRDWLRHNDDSLRRMLNFEPRGHGMMCSVLLMPPLTPEADYAVIIMEQDEYVPMCGHCIIGTATTLVATGMVTMREPVTTVRIDTPAGLVTCKVAIEGGRVRQVSFENVDSFLLYENREVALEDGGEVIVDIAYGGDFYVIVDADAHGLELTPENDSALIAAARPIIAAVNRQIPVAHPERPEITRCYQTMFVSRKAENGPDRQIIVCPPGSLDRSPCGTGTAARTALFHTRGELPLGEARRFEGVLGTWFTGKPVRAERRGDVLYVTPEVTGSAYITGFHTFVLDPADPLPKGFRMGPRPRDQRDD